MDEAERRGLVERLADLAVRGGANVQPDQVVAIGTEPGKEELTRAVAERAYRAGARFVDVAVFDLLVKRARVEHAAEDTLDWVPPWYGQRVRQLGELRAARIAFAGAVEPRALAGLDPERLGRDNLPFLAETIEVVNARTTNWTIVPCPTPGWAALVHGDVAPEERMARLWEDVAVVCRLDAEDPAAAWRERAARLGTVAARLTALGLDALRFTGPGTDLTVGLLPSSRWQGGTFETVGGIVHVPNVPTEEVFTTPDPVRTEGELRSTKPLVHSGTTIRGLRMRFSGGRAVEVTADEGGDVLAALTRRDEGAARLGEVALVDRESRVGARDTVFYDTLLDENAASHVALGGAYALAVGEEADRARMNESSIHIDFMIGADDVAVTGIARDGAEVPLLRGGAWQV